MSLKRLQCASTLVLGLVMIAGVGRADGDLKATAQRCADAMLALAAESIPCMHPSLIEGLGGADGAKAAMKRQADAIARQGATLESVSVGTPRDPVEINGRSFALVPQTTRIRVPQGMLRHESFLIAIREPGGKQWSFIDAAPATPEALARLFPDTTAAEFGAKLVIPPLSRPVLEE